MLPIIDKKCILCNAEAKTKSEVLKMMIEQLYAAGYVSDRDIFYEDVLNREAEFPTYIGNETGIPHGKSKVTLNNGICICNLKNPIPWNDNGDCVKLVIMIAVTDAKDGVEHLIILQKLSRLLMHDEFRAAIQEGTVDEIYQLLKDNLAK